METASFDLNAVIIPNVIGVVLLGVLVLGNVWRFREKSVENLTLLVLVLCTFANCLVDPLVYLVDGKPGVLNHHIITFGNTWLFLGQLTCAVCWAVFFCRHLNGKVSKCQRWILALSGIVGAILLLLNFFFPIAFEVSSENVYSRKSGFFIFAALNYGLFLDSIFIYLRSVFRGGVLKFFPMWVYAIPLVFGGVVQSLFYGISVNSVSLAVALAGVLSSLQNEVIFKDPLTGLYNRFYLNYLLKVYAKKRDLSVTGVMVDLNAFKAINDKFGHSVGDRALIHMAKILRKSIGDLGLVVRYAGDEFIIFINSQKENVVKNCLLDVRLAIEDFNEKNRAPYKLAASMGYCKLDFEKFNMDEFINEIDKRMYEDKQSFYDQNRQYDRRRR